MTIFVRVYFWSLCWFWVPLKSLENANFCLCYWAHPVNFLCFRNYSKCLKFPLCSSLSFLFFMVKTAIFPFISRASSFMDHGYNHHCKIVIIQHLDCLELDVCSRSFPLRIEQIFSFLCCFFVSQVILNCILEFWISCCETLGCIKILWRTLIFVCLF